MECLDLANASGILQNPKDMVLVGFKVCEGGHALKT